MTVWNVRFGSEPEVCYRILPNHYFTPNIFFTGLALSPNGSLMAATDPHQGG